MRPPLPNWLAWTALEPPTTYCPSVDTSTPNAEPGKYAALVGPEIVSTGTGAQVGAGAAAHLTFTVAESSGLDAFLRWLGRTIGQNPWIVVLFALALLLVVLWLHRKRFSFSVSRRA